MSRDLWDGLWCLSILCAGLFIGAACGYVKGVETAIENMQKEAVARKMAELRINEKTGGIEFFWLNQKEIKNDEDN